MHKRKNYEELTIRDHFMFGKICSKPENRKLILDSLLQTDFKEKYGEVEKYIQEYKDSKYSRLDLLAEDEEGTIYDAEMQNESNDKNRQEELPKRSRYYQALIDTAYLDTGGEYRTLPESYIIFICTFDPFGKNIPIYTFKTTCLETDLPKYDDMTRKIYFNTTADLTNLPQDMKNMLKYINDGTINDKATKFLNDEILKARQKEEWKAEYMLTLVHDKDVYRDGYNEGYDVGYEARQAELDAIMAEKNAIISEFDSIKKEFEEYKLTHK